MAEIERNRPSRADQQLKLEEERLHARSADLDDVRRQARPSPTSRATDKTPLHRGLGESKPILPEDKESLLKIALNSKEDPRKRVRNLLVL